jgi:Thioredoxin-like
MRVSVLLVAGALMAVTMPTSATIDAATREDVSPAAQAVFDPDADAITSTNEAMDRARARGAHTMIVFGGAWCHDSMALVELFLSPRFQSMLQRRYDIVYVDIPFDITQRSNPVAQRFGLGNIVGTPTVLILTPDGTPTNLTDAPRWRNAASRKPDAIFRHFSRAAPAIEGP